MPRSSPGWPQARQIPYLLYYSSDLRNFWFLWCILLDLPSTVYYKARSFMHFWKWGIRYLMSFSRYVEVTWLGLGIICLLMARICACLPLMPTAWGDCGHKLLHFCEMKELLQIIWKATLWLIFCISGSFATPMANILYFWVVPPTVSCVMFPHLLGREYCTSMSVGDIWEQGKLIGAEVLADPIHASIVSELRWRERKY